MIVIANFDIDIDVSDYMNQPTPASYTNLAGEMFTYKPGSADQWAEAEMGDDGDED